MPNQDLSPDVLAALEYARRFRKGLPSDRWCDGHAGAVKVAKGIEQLAAAVVRYMEEEERRGVEAMEAHADPMR
jgi:hypothetical protein